MIIVGTGAGGARWRSGWRHPEKRNPAAGAVATSSEGKLGIAGGECRGKIQHEKIWHDKRTVRNPSHTNCNVGNAKFFAPRSFASVNGTLARSARRRDFTTIAPCLIAIWAVLRSGNKRVVHGTGGEDLLGPANYRLSAPCVTSCAEFRGTALRSGVRVAAVSIIPIGNNAQ